MDEYIIGFWTSFFALILLIIPFLFSPLPSLGGDFWKALSISASINIIAPILLLKAYKQSDISLVSPLSTLTPVFLMLTGPLIIGEYIGFFGYVGIGFSILGSYILNISPKYFNFWQPIRSLFSNKGSRYMLLVAFLWSISSVYDKIGVQNSSPVFWLFIVKALGMIFFFFFVVLSKRSFEIKGNIISLFAVSLFGTIALLFQLFAVMMLPVIYVQSIKRLSAVLSVLWGRLFFQETNFSYRLIGSFLMLVGIAFLIL